MLCVRTCTAVLSFSCLCRDINSADYCCTTSVTRLHFGGTTRRHTRRKLSRGGKILHVCVCWFSTRMLAHSARVRSHVVIHSGPRSTQFGVSVDASAGVTHEQGQHRIFFFLRLLSAVLALSQRGFARPSSTFESHEKMLALLLTENGVRIKPASPKTIELPRPSYQSVWR